jgi:NitT/TauT family transport system substrate-binding protein
MSTHRTRRDFVKTAAAAGAASLLPMPYVHAQGTTRKVTMLLDWVFQGPNAGFMVAQAKGFYKEAGLDVEIGGGKGSGSTAQLIATKTSQFGFADGYVVANSVAKGMGLRNVASIYRRNPCAVIVLADSDIKTPKDLEGKSIGITAGSAQFQQWPAFVKGAKLDGSKITVVNVDGPGAGPALISGRLPAIAGFAQGYMPSVEIRGQKQVRAFWYADQGVNAISNGIIVHNDLLKSDPALVKAFVEPSIRGFLYARANIDEAVEVVRKHLPTADATISKREAEYSWRTWVTPNTRGRPLGWSAEADWKATLDVLREYGGVPTPPAIADITTNEFVPEGAAYVPPQDA